MTEKVLHGLEQIAEHLDCSIDEVRETYMPDETFPLARFGRTYTAIDVDLNNYIRSQYGKWRSNPTNEETSTGLDSQIPMVGELRDLLGQVPSVRRTNAQPKLSVVTKKEKQ